jgi:hypothetical protein
MTWIDDNQKFLEARKQILENRKSKVTTKPDTDISNVQGHLAVLKVYPGGSEELICEGRNTITDKGKAAFSRLLGAAYTGILTAEDWRPSVITLGSGAHASPAVAEIATGIVTPIVSTGGSPNVELSSFYWRDPGSSRMDGSEITIVNTHQLQIETELGKGEDAGGWLFEAGGASARITGPAGSISEAGLFYLQGSGFVGTATNMIAYKTFPAPIIYDSATADFSLLFRWTISFSNP